MLTLNETTLRALTAREVQSLILYEITYDVNEDPERLTTWREPIVFEGHVFAPAAIQDSGIKTNSDGKLEPVTLTVGNLDDERNIQGIIEQYDIIGKTVRRIHFINGAGQIREARFSITGAKAIKGNVAFSLNIGLDFLNSMLPARTVFIRFCRWQHSLGFRGAECKYAGPDTSCEFTIEACKQKGNIRNFGGYPGVMNSYFYF